MAHEPRSEVGRSARGRHAATGDVEPVAAPAPLDAREAGLVKVGRSDGERLVLVRLGAVIEIRLPAKATPPESSNPALLVVVDVVPVEAADKKRNEWVARVRAQHAGEATLTSKIHTGSRTGVVRPWSIRVKVSGVREDSR